MKITLPSLLAILACLLCPPIARADTSPQLFGEQEGAYVPWTSWKGTYLAVTDEDTSGFRMWNVATRRSLWKSEDFLLSFSRDDKTVMVAHSEEPLDGDLANLDGVTLRLRDAQTGRLLRQMTPTRPTPDGQEVDQVLEYGFTPEGGEFIMVTQDLLRIYDTRTGNVRLARKWSGLKPDVSPIIAALTFDKKQLVIFDGDLVVLDARTGALVRRMPQMKPSVTAQQAFDDGPDALEVSPDNFLLVENFEEENNSRVYRLSDGKLLWSTDDWPTFSLDGKLAFVPTPKGLNVLDAHTGRKLKSLAGPKEYGFDISTDGNWLYETRDGKIYRWPTR